MFGRSLVKQASTPRDPSDDPGRVADLVERVRQLESENKEIPDLRITKDRLEERIKEAGSEIEVIQKRKSKAYVIVPSHSVSSTNAQAIF